MAAITSAVVGAVGVASSISASRKANKTAKAAQQSQEQILSRQQDIADEQWENYKTNYLPLEQDYLETAKNFGSIANQEKAAANASAAVAGRFASAKDELNRTPGLDPNSQQYLRTKAKIELAEAANSAAGQTAARENVEKTGAAMLQDAASLGKGVSGNAVASLNAAASGASNYANSTANRAGASSSGVGQMVGGLYQSGAFNAIGNMFSPSAPSQYALSSGSGTTAVNGIGLASGGGYGLSSGGGLGLQAPAGW